MDVDLTISNNEAPTGLDWKERKELLVVFLVSAFTMLGFTCRPLRTFKLEMKSQCQCRLDCRGQEPIVGTPNWHKSRVDVLSDASEKKFKSLIFVWACFFPILTSPRTLSGDVVNWTLNPICCDDRSHSRWPDCLQTGS